MTGTSLNTPAREISVTEFKAHCLALFDEVALTGETLVVTKRGKPIARVQRIDEPRDLRGTVTYNVSDEELIAPLYPDWEPTA